MLRLDNLSQLEQLLEKAVKVVKANPIAASRAGTQQVEGGLSSQESELHSTNPEPEPTQSAQQ